MSVSGPPRFMLAPIYGLRPLESKDVYVATDEQEIAKLDTSVPQTARIWNYWLGGKDNFEVDRQVGEEILKYQPAIADNARHCRAYLVRVVRFLAGEAGIRQFLDIGTGLPTANNTHEVAQSVAPESRIVYVDNDPMVLVHARALLTSTPAGATDYIDADLRDTTTILRDAQKTLDFTQPVAVILSGILNFIVDDTAADAIVSRLIAAVPSGSYLVISHPTEEVNGPAVRESMRQWNESGAAPITARSRDGIAAFCDGLEILSPGVVTCTAWRPDPEHPGITDKVSEFAGVGRKP